jgi:hypothetical protein
MCKLTIRRLKGSSPSPSQGRYSLGREEDKSICLNARPLKNTDEGREHTDKKENEIFLICKEIQMGSGAKSYMKKDILIQYTRKCANI